MKRILSAWFLTVAFFAIGAAAQDPVGSYINSTIYQTRAFNSVFGNLLINRSKGKTARSNAPKPAKPETVANYTAYKENPNVSLAATFAKAAGKDARSQQEAKQKFDYFISFYKQTAAKDGFPANDLAYAFEYFVVNNYNVYHDLVNVPYEKDPRIKRAGNNSFDRLAAMDKKKLLMVTIAQETTVYNQFKSLLSENPDIKNMTDAQKQEATELLAIITGFNFMSYAKGINDGDEELLEKARQMAKEGLEKLFNSPVDTIKISYKGLEL